MTSITTRQGARGAIWRVQFRIDGRLTERTFRSEEDARDWALTAAPPAKPRTSNLHASRLNTRSAEIVEEAEFMLSVGRGLAYLADAFSMKRTSLERALYRAGRHDLVVRDRQIAEGAVA